MTEWEVTALCSAHIPSVYGDVLPELGVGGEILLPVWYAAATDGVHRVLVDTGVRDGEYAQMMTRAPCIQSSEEKTEAVIKKVLGWEPSDVDIVINTHLHHDHCGNNYLFRNARFFCQRKEWEAAYAPLPSEKVYYDEALFGKYAVPYCSWEFLDGDCSILPGLSVIFTPGHTRGHQSVLFTTKQGTVCVAGDIAPTERNVNENLRPKILCSEEDAYLSLKKIRDVANWVIPGHEPDITHGAVNFKKVK